MVVGPDSVVSLREITKDTVIPVCRLAVSEDQERFVAPNAFSLAEALFHEEAWYRAIHADETPVGFAMISDRPELPEYFLWRFMIDGRHQGRGYGRRALELLIEHVRTRPGATTFDTSVVQAPGGPQGFYERLGFGLTGDIEDGEAVMRLML